MSESELTRRRMLASTVAASAGLVSTAQAAQEQQPAALYGTVEGTKVTLPPLHAASEGAEELANAQPVDSRMGIAVVGLGHLSLEQIMPGFAEAKHVRCTALVSGHRDKALAIAAQYGVPKDAVYDYANFEALKDNKSVQIIYIVLPNAMHAEFTERAAKIGKHVLCEKPMAANVEQAERMIKACRDANVKLMIAYRMQYNKTHQNLIKAVRSKAFGELRMIEAVNAQNDAAPGQWRQIEAMAGGGSLPDVGIYCLNAFRYITGEEPIEVTGAITRPKDDPRFKEVEDLSTFTLRFPSGVLAVGSAGYSTHETRRLRAMATKGWVGLDPAFGYFNVTMQIGHHAEDGNALEQRTLPPQNQFAIEMDHFAEAIRANREAHTPGEEGLQDQKIVAAIYESAKTGRPVQMPLIEKLDPFRGPLKS